MQFRRALRNAETRDVRSRMQVEHYFAWRSQLVIILPDPFPNLGRHDSHHRIGAGVVFGMTSEHLDSQGPLLEVFRLTVERVLNDVAQKGRVLPAVSEAGAGEDALQLLPNRGPFSFRLGQPG